MSFKCSIILVKVEVARERRARIVLLKTFSFLKNLNKLAQVFGLGIRKHFMLDIDVIVFTITLLGNERLNT